MKQLNELAARLFGAITGRVNPEEFFPSGTSSERPSAPAAFEAADRPERPAGRFRAYDARYDIEAFLRNIEAPMVHLLIEDQPSTNYNLPGYVLESRITGEWFVFERGRLALQGNGGGASNMASVSQLLSERDIKVIGWVIRRDDLEELEEGRLTWPRAKQDLVPLVSYQHAEEDWHWAAIKRRFETLMQATAVPGRAA